MIRAGRRALIPSGKHELIWKRFDGQRADPDILSALNAYLTRGDFAAARAKPQVRLTQAGTIARRSRLPPDPGTPRCSFVG